MLFATSRDVVILLRLPLQTIAERRQVFANCFPYAEPPGKEA